MKKVTLILIFTFISIYTFSQNLVKNHSFEELKAPYTNMSLCYESFNKYVSNWLSIALFSAEVYKYDSTSLLSNNDFMIFSGLIRPHSGCCMVAIHTYGINNINEPYRSYIEGKLIKPLIKGKKYHIEFSIAPFGTSNENISNNIGVYFTTKLLPIAKESILNYKPQINYSELPEIIKGMEWITLSWNYIAQDTFKYFTIGNFFSNSSTKFKQFQKNDNVNWVDFLIDDVKIEEISDLDTMKEKNLLNKMELNKPLTLNNIYFETGKSNLLDSSFTELNTLFNILKSKPKMMIQISGYTDNTGNAQDNIVLSETRANAVKKYLIDKGIDNNRIIAKGYGSSNSKASNDTAEGRAKNRRVEIMVLKNE